MGEQNEEGEVLYTLKSGDVGAEIQTFAVFTIEAHGAKIDATVPTSTRCYVITNTTSEPNVAVHPLGDRNQTWIQDCYC